MRYKISKNKKGIGIDDALPLIVFILIAAFVIFVFRIYDSTKLDKTIKSIQQPKDEMYGHEILINYLSQTDSKGNSKAKIISELYVGGEYDQISIDLQAYFKSKLEPIARWDIDIVTVYNENVLSVKGGFSPNADKRFINSIKIPINSQKPNYLSIRLFMSRDLPIDFYSAKVG
ncbi:MAG TPA: hypothetical protein VJJ52_06030 [Candidatus Nanoarchaeia archaeon]|nr:hypothetical protein [Candidatus Nanoarchaeia archaeon]